MSDPDRIVKNRAAGYLWQDEALWNAPVSRYHSRYLGAIAATGGGMGSTVMDVAKWEAALCGEKILRRSTLELMWTPAKLNSGEFTRFGLGWWLQSISGERKIGVVTLTLIKVATQRLGATEVVKTPDGIAVVYSSKPRALGSPVLPGLPSPHLPMRAVRYPALRKRSATVTSLSPSGTPALPRIRQFPV